MTVAAYFGSLPPDRAAELEKLRAFVAETLPDASEDIRYKMPAFVTTELVCTLAAQKRHFALYVCDPDLLNRYRNELANLDLGKGCIRFKRFDDLPLDTIAELLRDAAKTPGWKH